MRRWSLPCSMVATCALFVILPAGIAAADAAGPTDYRSEVIAIEPAFAQLHASIVGGDSFLLLRVDRGTVVEVLGYRSEPFIRFLADGTVQENRTSASYFVSRTRRGDALPGDFADDAAPQWHTVATDGEYAWHDHRMHWMTDTRPPGKRPGDVVLRQDVALLVDGTPAIIIVQSVWMGGPSSVPMWLGAAAGLLAALPLVLPRRGFAGRTNISPALVVALLATFVGIWQFRTFPPETGPQVVWFSLPAIAAGALVAALLVTWRRETAHALALLAGANLVLWAWMRRDGFTKAILPTNAPAWLDRFASMAALSCGVLLAGSGLAALVNAIARPRRTTSGGS